MQTQFRSVLWLTLVLSSPACGTSDRVAPVQLKPTVTTPIAKLEPAIVAPVPAVVPMTPAASAVVAKPALPTKYSEAMVDGKAAAEKGDNARARELFEAAILLDKKAAEPHLELARLFIATKDKGQAIAAAKKAVKLSPDSSRAWNTLGRAELARWMYEPAIVAFKKAAELDPDNAWAWNNLGYTELQFKGYQAAVDALVIAVTKPGATGFMWNNLGTAYEQLNELDEARAAFEHGGKLGSKESVASRKRLQGVTPMIAVAQQGRSTNEKLVPVMEQPYAHREESNVVPSEEPDETPAESEPPDAVIEVPDDAGAETAPPSRTL